ncbi:MAG: DUF2336 domain-containing protein, partial [Rhizomicrobium sp.]
MSIQAPRFAMLADLAKETSSEGRRELLRKVTDALVADNQNFTAGDHVVLDELLCAVASEYSTRFRAEIAQLVARSNAPIVQTVRQFALDEIEVAAPILKHSRVLTEADLLNVVASKSQDHLLAVTKRPGISEGLSHALVERGDDTVVASLLQNERADIAVPTYEALAVRAQDSRAIQGPLVRRQGVPLDLLNDLYLQVEDSLRREILDKFDQVSSDEVDRAFLRSRNRIAKSFRDLPRDYEVAKKRIDALSRRGALAPTQLVSLLREGQTARTSFKLALSRLVDVGFELVQRVVEGRDLDTLALLCRGAGFERALFVTIAVGLDNPERALAGAEAFGKLYESVPVGAAQRAIRFWKVRTNV